MDEHPANLAEDEKDLEEARADGDVPTNEFGTALQLCQEAFQAAANLRREEASELNERARALAEKIEGEQANLMRGVVGAMILMVDTVIAATGKTTPEDRKRITEELEAAVRELREFKRAGNEDLAVMLLPMEIQALSLARENAKASGDTASVRLYADQMRTLLASGTDEQQEQLGSVLMVVDVDEVHRLRREAIHEMQQMDLGRAVDLIGKGRALAEHISASLQDSGPEGVLFETVRRMMTGQARFFRGLDTYIRTHHDAVVGDVKREHVQMLEQAEADYRSGGEDIFRASQTMGVWPEGMETAEELIAGPVAAARNLRELCRSSLKPTQWAKFEGLRFVGVFLATVAVLLVAAPWATGSAIEGTLVVYLVLTAFVTALIGTFTYQALRFVPLLRFLAPRSASPREGDGDETKEQR